MNANVESQCAAEMPKYRCHKAVWALKIKSISRDELSPAQDPSADREEPGATITPVESGYAPFHVDAAYTRKHKPVAGGYYVVYADGYRSFSPAAAFEEGYTRI